MSRTIKFIASSLGKKYVMALTGMFLGFFLIVHAAGNSSIFFGRAAFISYAEHLHALGILVNLFEITLLTVFLVHIITGLVLFFQNNQAKGSKYTVPGNAGRRTWGSRTMPYTGVAIFLFVLIHLLNFHFTDHSRPIADIVSTVLASPVYTLIYTGAMLVLALHITHGFWSIFQSLGLYHPNYNCVIRRTTLWLARIIVFIFLIIPFLLLFFQNFLR